MIVRCVPGRRLSRIKGGNTKTIDRNRLHLQLCFVYIRWRWAYACRRQLHKNGDIMKVIIKRGEIYYADLSPVVGSVQGWIRSVWILQNDKENTVRQRLLLRLWVGGLRISYIHI